MSDAPFGPWGVLQQLVVMDGSELEDFLAMASFPATHGKRRRAAKASAKQSAGEGPPVGLQLNSGGAENGPAQAGEIPEEPVEEHLVARADLEVVPPRRLQQRGPEVLAIARGALAKRRQEDKLNEERAKRLKAETQLQVVAVSNPALAKSIGLSTSPALPESVASELMVKLAAMPPIRSALFELQRKRQTKALRVVARCLENSAHDYWAKLTSGALSTSGASAGTNRVLMFSCQWDETSQKFRALRQSDASSRQASTAPIVAQVMVFSGAIHDLGISGQTLRSEPFFSKTMVVRETSANFLLEGIVRSIPFKYEDRDSMYALGGFVDAFVWSCLSTGRLRTSPCSRRVAQERPAMDGGLRRARLRPCEGQVSHAEVCVDWVGLSHLMAALFRGTWTFSSPRWRARSPRLGGAPRALP